MEVHQNQTEGLNIYRATGILNLTPEQCRDLLFDFEHISALDDTVGFGYFLFSKDQAHDAVLSVIEVSVPFLHPRDTIDLSTWEVDDATGVYWQSSFGVSVPGDVFPTHNDHIRVRSMKWYIDFKCFSRYPRTNQIHRVYKIVPVALPDGKIVSNTTLVWQADPGGWLPKWLSNLTTGKGMFGCATDTRCCC